MRPADILRNTPFRLALSFAGMTLAALVIGGGIAYRIMATHLDERQDARITEIVDGLSLDAASDDPQEIVDAIEARIAAAPDQRTLLSLRDAGGQILAGNIPPVDTPEGWSYLSGETVGLVADLPYRVFTTTLGGRRLIVGQDNADLAELGEIMLGAFGWSVLSVLIIALAGGSLIAVRVRGRLEGIEAAMELVAEGDLSARIPLSGGSDDIDALAAAINAALDRLSANVEAMRQVSADIAHDLRTPLNRLHQRLESAISGMNEDEPATGELTAALRESEAIGETFSALLRIAQIDAGARRERFARLDLSALAADLTEVYSGVAEDAGMVLHFHSDGVAAVEGDREILTQMLANLIENAIRHCPKGTVISCDIRRTDSGVTASVSDNGPGIPDGEREKVLRRLYRLEKSRTTAGSGLGLALVKAVADLHGAVLALDDANPGLRVSVAFPVAGHRA